MFQTKVLRASWRPNLQPVRLPGTWQITPHSSAANELDWLLYLHRYLPSVL
jgi:hypothetical protein